MKFVERLSRLRVEIDIPRKIKTLHLLNISNHDSLTFRLPHKTEHLRMSRFAEDNNLRLRTSVILSLYPSLQLQHHRASGIDNLDVVLPCQLIRRWRFAVSPQQHFHPMQSAHLLVIDCHESQLLESFTFHTVVHNVAQAV